MCRASGFLKFCKFEPQKFLNYPYLNEWMNDEIEDDEHEFDEISVEAGVDDGNIFDLFNL